MPLRRIFPQFLAMIVQFCGAGKAAAAIIAAPARDRRQSSAELHIFFKSRSSQGWGVWGGEVTSCGYRASLVQASYNVCAMPARF